MNLVQLTSRGRVDLPVTIDPTVDRELRAGAACAIGVSGGKDSTAQALATVAYLEAIGHTGPRVLIHADLGRVEWRESLPVCERLAAFLGLELIVVRRQAGDMMDRWLGRWRNNLQRYVDLSCVKLILPWSTPAMRFCTSELKTAPICSALVKRFPGRTIVSCAGIRRDESSARAKAEVAKLQRKLESKKHATWGIDWHPIIDWKLADVLAYIAHRGVELHEAYTKFDMSRVSCAFCIMSNEADLTASASCPDNHAIYREMTGLEIVSGFAFQGSRWLGDVAPHLLDAGTLYALERAKWKAQRRAQIEARIPGHLLYTAGWPTVMPTPNEAAIIASVRCEIAELYEIAVTCTTPDHVTARYASLMAQKEANDGRARRRPS